MIVIFGLIDVVFIIDGIISGRYCVNFVLKILYILV